MQRAIRITGVVTLEEHKEWAARLWSRIDRDKNGEISVEELHCNEFLEALRLILSPMAGASVGSYGRSEINMTQVLQYCIKMADTDRNGTLDSEEFELFLRRLRRPKRPMELASLYLAMFDADPDALLEEPEFRDMWRYFTGRNPTAEEFQMHFSFMDVSRTGRVSKKSLAKWLAKAPEAFRSLAPPVLEDETEGSILSRKSVKSQKIFRPAPGLWHRNTSSWESAHEWNSVPKDVSDQNLAWRGCHSMKSYFSRPESLPELRRFYASHRGFQSHKRRLTMPEPKTRRPILSQENLQFVTQPGWERHEAKAPNVKGEMAEWKQLTPRGQRKQARDVGTLLLRVPLPPAPHLVHGRGAPLVPAPVPAPAA